MRGKPDRRRALCCLAHLLPQRQASLGVIAGAGCKLEAHEVGIALVVAVKFQGQQAAALARELTHVTADDEPDRQCTNVGERYLSGTGASVFAQCMGHLMAE